MQPKEYKNRFATIEQQSDKTWLVFNDVTGLLVAHCHNFKSARSRMTEITQRYLTIEKGYK